MPPAAGVQASRRVPGPLQVAMESLSALISLVRRRLAAEWAALPLYRILFLDRPAATFLAFTPRDFRPVAVAQGRALLEGRLSLAGTESEIGVHGDPWDRPSPSRRFAVALHQFSWLPGLLAAGPAGEREALRLFVTWRAEFERPAPFVWGSETLERRTFHLACGAHRMAPHASDAEARLLAVMLARHTRRLADITGPDIRRAERLTVACIGAGALADPVGGALLRRLLPRLARWLDRGVGRDGGIASRSPQQGLELLYDLLTLDDLLTQRGLPPPAELSRALEALTTTTAFLRLRDGRLASFQGGSAVDANTVDGALVQFDPASGPAAETSRGGFHRIASRRIEVLVDGAPAAEGAFSLSACDQPLALEVVCDGVRVITGCGWTPSGPLPDPLRRIAGGSTAALGPGSPGRVLTGLRRAGLGARLVPGTRTVSVQRTVTDEGSWLELQHDGWLATPGLTHVRRLFLDHTTTELRGEDAFLPGRDRRRPEIVPYAIRFHLAPGVQVSLARDDRSVLIRGAADQGWWLRNDAQDVTLEPTLVCLDGQPRRSTQVLLRGAVPSTAEGVRVRWKLTPVDPATETVRRRGKAPGGTPA